MLKGLRALFSTGVILNPMVWGGVILGFLFAFKLEDEAVLSVYEDYHLYLFALFAAAVYSFGFKRVYHEGGQELDLTAMFFEILFNGVKLVFSSVMAVLFVWMISF